MKLQFAKTTPQSERNEIIKYYSKPKKKKHKKRNRINDLKKEKKRRWNQHKADIYSRCLIKKTTKTEKILLNIFNEDGMIFQFQRRFWSDTECYIVDFFFKNLHGMKYVIEIDGKSHNSKRQKEYDKKRTLFLERKRNCSVVRFTNDEVFNQTEYVISEIYNLLPKFYK